MNNYLFDTHSLLWAIWQPDKLGQLATAILESSYNNEVVGSITFLEISLKYALGKLTFGCKPDDLPKVADDMGLAKISLSLEEAAPFYQLPKLSHKDPFDRMLIWQAISRDLVLISQIANSIITANMACKPTRNDDSGRSRSLGVCFVS